MRIECIAFTDRGLSCARRIARALANDGETVSVSAGFGDGKADLSAWAKRAFSEADALLFVGATGIAVRAIAPFVASKLVDPAVIVVDEGARWAISLLSGHVGGANRLAARVAAACGADPVVTTATDGRGLWAVDEWAARRGMAIANPERIKAVSARLLAGDDVAVFSFRAVCGAAPRGVRLADDPSDAHVVISPFVVDGTESAGFEPLVVVPRCATVGLGCRKGTDEGSLAAAVDDAIASARLHPLSIAELRSIDLKRDEEGILALCEARGWPFSTLCADELAAVAGSVTPSAFVKSVTGVDNVCERAALSAGGRLVTPKRSAAGATVAIAVNDTNLAWEDEA